MTPETITLTFTGDIMCNGPQNASCRLSDGTYDYSPLLSGVAPLLRKGDYCVGNLETPLTDGTEELTGKLYSFSTPGSFAKMLRDAGFDFVSTANNHCLDRGVPGLKKTLDQLDLYGLAHGGTARTVEERMAPNIRTIRGFRIGFVCYTYGTNAFANHTFLAPEDAHCVNLFQPQETLSGSVHLLNAAEIIDRDSAECYDGATVDPDAQRCRAQVEADIAACKAAGAEFVIVLMHSGGQYNREPDPYTERLVRFLCEAGADLIVGHHPHVVHRADLTGRVPIFYSLGNFTFASGESPENAANPISATALILHVTLSRDERGAVRMSGAEFELTRSDYDATGRCVVRSLSDALSVFTASEENERIATDALRVARTFLNCADADGLVGGITRSIPF